jgi:hypothetical protein
MDNTITISVDEYRELIKAYTILGTIRAAAENDKYITNEDVLKFFGVYKTATEEDDF